jgi:hypothetical protein
MATDTHIPERNQRLSQNLGDYKDLISKEAALIVYSARMNCDSSTRGEVESIISSGVIGDEFFRLPVRTVCSPSSERTSFDTARRRFPLQSRLRSRTNSSVAQEKVLVMHAN